MDLLGARFRPLPNSPRYGPKTWKQDSDGVWVEQEMTKEEKDFARLESTLLCASPHFPWERSTPITEEDAEKEPRLKDYVDGFAMFPKVANINETTEAGKAAARKQERLWQEHAEKMHTEQVAIKVADKPTEIVHKYHPELKRGD